MSVDEHLGSLVDTQKGRAFSFAVIYGINPVLPTVITFKGTSLIPRDDKNFV